MKIGIIGLGFVGLSFASVLGSKGYSVIGVDSDKNKIKKIKSGKSPFYEPKLENILKKALSKSLEITSGIEKAVDSCKIIFITVGTPLSTKGHIDLRNIQSVSKTIGKILKKSDNVPVIVVKSTVVPSTTNQVIRPIIEKTSKKLEGVGFNILTNPEFLREGKAIDDTLNPHIIVIGGDNAAARSELAKFYKSLYKSKIPYVITNSQTAELIKYANNSFLATKISFINQIANICESVSGANVDDIARAIGYDPRIGNLFLNAGPGYGGSCLPKDLQALISFSSKAGQPVDLLQGVQKTNSKQISNLTKIIRKFVKPEKKITVLGLSFKENSDDIRESASIKLIEKLLQNKYKITVHDPKAIDNTKAIFNDKIKYARSIQEALKDSHCAIIMTSWDHYKRIKNGDFGLMKNKTLIDTRRILDKHQIRGINYYAIGIGSMGNS
jgi:UDPglucose 6-dehydrogenase